MRPLLQTRPSIAPRARFWRRLSRAVENGELILRSRACTLLRVSPRDAPTTPTLSGVPSYWLGYGESGWLRAWELSAGASHALPNDTVQLFTLLLPAHGEKRMVRSNPSDARDAVGTRLLLNDSNVNIWEFRLAPGESCPFHTHRLPYFYLNLTANHTQALDEYGVSTGEPYEQSQGRTCYVPTDMLGSHGVRNVGGSLFLQFLVEFKSGLPDKYNRGSVNSNADMQS